MNFYSDPECPECLYRDNLKGYYKGRTAYVSIEKPGKDRLLYYLVYLSRHSLGIDTFKTEAEKMDILQRTAQAEIKLRRQLEQAHTDDLFADCEVMLVSNEPSDNRFSAKGYLLGQLSSEPIEINHDTWADFLEETDLYPKDFQLAMRELVKEGVVENIDADVTNRRTQIIKRDWPGRAERWRLIL